MAVQDLLSQDEIDALLHGVDDGLVETEVEATPGSVKSYDLTSQDRIVRGRMPTLGLGMLVEQAAEAFFLWRGVRPASAPVLETLRRQLATV